MFVAPDFDGVEAEVDERDESAWDNLCNSMDARLQAAMETAGVRVPYKPEAALPTLDDAEDDMDIATADILHHQVGTWLEYVNKALARAEVQVLFAEDEISMRSRTVKFVHGEKVQEWPQEDFKILLKLEEKRTDLKAMVLLLKGQYDSLNKVKAVASRTVTRHKVG